MCKDFKLPNKQEWFYLNPSIIMIWNSLKDSNFVEMPQNSNSFIESQINYKDKYKEALSKIKYLETQIDLNNEAYEQVVKEIDILGKELKTISDYKQKYVNKSIEYENLKSELLEVYQKYTALLEKQY